MAKAERLVDDEPEEAAETSVRDDLEAARDEVNARETTETQGNEAPSASAQAAEGRDTSGRFTKRTETEQSEARVQSSAESNPQAQGAQSALESTEPAPQTTLAPQGWTPAGKAIWSTLPEAARMEIMKREADVHRKISAQDEERTVARQFNEITQAHAEMVQKTGLHPLRLYQDFLGYAKTLQSGSIQDKAQLLRQIAINNQIDPRALAGIMPPPGTNSQQPQGQSAPPQLTSLPPEVADTVKWAKEFQQRQQEDARKAEESAQQKTLEEIVAFRSKPEARFFDAVKDQMIALLQAGAVGDLEEAYNQAIWTRPDIREILRTEEANKASAERSKAQKTQQARNRGGSIRGGAGGTQTTAPGTRSLREELEANFAEASSRI